ncbi:MAG: hypothetical protein AB1696_29210 [Planctomycetota bacterium]
MNVFLLTFYGLVFILMGVVAALWIVKMTKSAFGSQERDENNDD